MVRSIQDQALKLGTNVLEVRLLATAIGSVQVSSDRFYFDDEIGAENMQLT
jgi:hypothetical protein